MKPASGSTAWAISSALLWAAAWTAIGVTAVWATPARAEPPIFVTADRKSVETPAIAPMVAARDCMEMIAVLERIDATEYRAGRPRPRDDADLPLFVYEQQLSQAFYQVCDAPQPTPAPPRRGFGLSAN